MGRWMRRWLPELTAALVVALVVGLAVVRADGGADLRPRVDAAMADLAGWSGATHRGTLVGPSNVVTSVELKVTADGAAHGTMTRPFGARAELAVNKSGSLLKANREWWLSERPTAADALVDQWIADPPDVDTGMPPLAQLTPRALAEQLTAPPDAAWTERVLKVAGRPSRVISDGTRQFAVGVDAPRRVLAVDLPIHRTLPPAPRAYVSSAARADELEPPRRNMLTWRAKFDAEQLDEAASTAVRETVAALRNTLGPQRSLSEITELPPAVDPAALDRLLQSGIDAERLTAAELGVHGPSTIALLDALIRPYSPDPNSPEHTSPVLPRQALTLVEQSMQFRIANTIDQLIRSRRFMSRHKLAKYVADKIVYAGDDGIRNGGIRQLEFAASLTRIEGNLVWLEEAPWATGERLDADVAVKSPTEATVWQVWAPTGENAVRSLGDKYEAKTRQVRNARPTEESGLTHVNRGLAVVPDPLVGALGEADRNSVGRMLHSADIHGRSEGAVDKVLIRNFHQVTDESRDLADHEFTPNEIREFGEGGGPPGGAPGSPGQPDPAPRGGGAPAPEAADSPAAQTAKAPEAPVWFSKPGRGTTEGPLSKATTRAVNSPGGIDLSTLELRYLADSSSEYVRDVSYAFSARSASGPTDRAAGLRAVGQASDALFVWLSLPQSSLWVNLNPDEPNRITDERLGRTDVGRILLEADLELKRSAARLTHPDTPTGAQYWREYDRLTAATPYCLPLRLWIVPGPASIHEEDNAVHILAAPLVVQVEKANFAARPRGRACAPAPPTVIQQYEATARALLLPVLQRAVDEGPEFADLRRVYFSRVAAEWYRHRDNSEGAAFADVLRDQDIAPWVSREQWSPRDVYDRYLRSFHDGEYTATRATPDGARQEVSYGGITLDQVPLNKVDDDEFEARAPGVADVVDGAFDQPSRDQAGRVWLAASTQSGFNPYAYLFLAAAGLLVLLYARRRWRRYRRGRAEARATRSAKPRPAQSAEARLAQLRREAERMRRGG